MKLNLFNLQDQEYYFSARIDCSKLFVKPADSK